MARRGRPGTCQRSCPAAKRAFLAGCLSRRLAVTRKLRTCAVMRAALRGAALHSAAPHSRAFSVVSRLKNFVLGRVDVGKDEVARYFVQQSGGAGPPRRMFELHKAGADFTDVSPEWLAWLRGTRAEPPTAGESARLAEQRAAVQRNAAERARAEALRRDRARVLKSDAAAEGPADALGAGVHSWTPGAKDK